MQNESKYKTTLRWLSILPVSFTVIILSDWVVRFCLWIMTLPIIFIERNFGFGIGPIGQLMDSATNYLVGVDSLETITIIATGLLTGYMIIYIPTTVSPSSRKKTTKILTVICLLLIGGVFLLMARYWFFTGWDSFSSLMQNMFPGGDILMGIFLAVGIASALLSAKKQTEQENNKYDNFVSNNIFTIFIVSVLFTVLMMKFYLY